MSVLDKMKPTVIGLGLIGSSLCLALKEREGVCPRGVECNPDRAEEALRQGIVSDVITLDEALTTSRFIILAAEVDKIKELIINISGKIRPGSIVTDVGSTKEEIVKLAEESLPQDVNFIGGHPMAGSEKSGPWAAKGNLFEGAPYILTPAKHTKPEYLKLLKKFVKVIGAYPLIMTPCEHDKFAAVISHIPHILACILVDYANDKSDLKLAGGGFKDMTRVAQSNPQMWAEICLSNKNNIIKSLEEIKKLIDEFQSIMEKGGKNTLKEFFRAARDIRKEIKK